MLEIEAAGMRFRARLEESAAPATVAAFRAILPFGDRIIWGATAGMLHTLYRLCVGPQAP